jgi:hypothetical protein
MTRTCPICGTENLESALFCSKCGVSLTQEKRTEKHQASQTVSVLSERIPSPGMCHYHQSIKASYICSRCGRSICGNCARKIGGIIFCLNCAPLKETVISKKGIISAAMTLALAALIMISNVLYSIPIKVLLDLSAVVLLAVSAYGMMYMKKWAGGLAVIVIITHWFFLPLIALSLIGIPLSYYLTAVLPALLPTSILVFVLRGGSLISILLAWSKFE